MLILIYAIITLSLASGIFFTGYRYGASVKQAQAEKAAKEALEHETEKLVNRPKSNDDVVKRLRQWAERVRKTEDKSK